MARINASSEAQRQGIRSARLKKAQAGEIYVSIDSLDPVVFDVPHTASDEEMWRAQIHLWVVGDVVEAIRRTNEQKLRNLSPEQRNVLRSPVKRLVSLSVEKEYYTGGSVALLSQRRRGRTISRRRGREMRGAPDYEEEMRREEMERERMGAMMGRGGARDRPTQAASPPETLTQRVCTKDYDVLHYSFTVVLPVEHLPLLQANLMRGGSHTILGMTIDEMGSGANQAGKGRQMRTRQGASEELYYYGNDPVVQVTLIGELLLMTSWERGTWDNDKNEWSTVLPPLMPVEVLDGLSRSLPDAMRSEDDRRLSELSGDEAATARPGW